MVVAMRRCRQALRAGDRELKGRDAAIRSFSGDQEAYRERPETDGLVRRIDVRVNGRLYHLGFNWENARFLSHLINDLPSSRPVFKEAPTSFVAFDGEDPFHHLP